MPPFVDDPVRYPNEGKNILDPTTVFLYYLSHGEQGHDRT
jgi:hypothetical protein